jgi:4-hydroxyacetophenone monooxygenase
MTARGDGEEASDLREILGDLPPVPLALAVVHLTGKLDVIRSTGPTRPPEYSGDGSGGLAPDAVARIGDAALDAVFAWRAAGGPPPYIPTDAELGEMADFAAGAAMPADYTDLFREELGIEGDLRDFAWSDPAAAARARTMSAMVIGAGSGGLAVALRLKQAGFALTIVEKNQGVGGTWHENRYPGCRVDVPSHCYSYSFIRDYPWPELFSRQPELQRYFDHCAEELGLRTHVRFGTEVLGARFLDDEGVWEVRLRGPDGVEEVARVNILVSAVGQLNRASIPAIPGDTDYKGICVHSSAWPKEIDLHGRRVAVIGNAATGIQLVPRLAEQAEHVTVFQRSPTWMAIHPEYTRAIRPAEQWALDTLPGFARWYRVMTYAWAIDGKFDRITIDPEWKQAGSISAANAVVREKLISQATAILGDRPDLIEKLIPAYPPYVKRPNVNDGSFYRALMADNAELVTDGVARFTADGIEDGAGHYRPFDMVVYCTGFQAQKFLTPMEIVGRDGISINDYWQDEPAAYNGVSVPGFPNFFMIYGPGTNLGHNGNIILNAECQAAFVMAVLRATVEGEHRVAEVRPGPFADHVARLRARMATMSFSHASTTNWYRNAQGVVTTNSPWTLLEYWTSTRSVGDELLCFG